jgi:hypothetical protein
VCAAIGCNDPGPAGPQGPEGPKGDKGDPGPVTFFDGGVVVGPQGPAGPPGASVQITPLGAGDPSCGTGGVRLTVGQTVTTVCNGAAGPQGPTGAAGSIGPMGSMGPAGPSGAQGPAGPQGPGGTTGATGSQGPAGPAGPAGPSVTLTSLGNGDASCPYGGTQLSVGSVVTHSCNGAPGGGGSVTLNGGIPPISFAGYTPSTYGANLGGRSGAHALCAAAFSGSHFCTNWEVDQANPSPPPGSPGAWVDIGNGQPSSRLFRASYSTNDVDTCSGWTSSSATVKPDGINLGRGQIFTQLGGIDSSFVGSNDGGCENARPLACCRGGTAVRFRGFTGQTFGANLSGRTGANAICNQSFAGSHFCTDWEIDQAAVPAPIPGAGAWIDLGQGSTTNRVFRASYSVNSVDTCAGWTSSSPTVTPDGINLGRGSILTSLGGVSSSFVGSNDGGCEVARPLACCDGFPPQ